MADETEINSAETEAKILRARIIGTRPYSDPIPRATSFGALFQSQVEERGDQVFLIWREGDERLEWTYRAFYEKCARIANWLLQLGIKPDERVATFAYNHPDTVAIIFASWMIGACVVPINVGEADDRVVFIQENAGSRAVFVMPDLIERYQALRPADSCVEFLIQINGDAHPNFRQLNEADSQSSQLSSHLAHLETEALLVYTSGTTGLPKGVLLQHHQLLADAHSIAEWYSFAPHDRLMLVLPIHHVNGLIVTLVTPVYCGGSVVLNRKFSASRYWEIAREEGATCGSTVPTILAFLCEHHKNDAPQDLGKFGFVICGAGPLTIELGARFEEKFGIPIIHGYGLSETTAYSCFVPFDLSPEEHKHWMRDWGFPSIGVPISCNEMAIHDDNGRELSPGERGEIVARGQNVMKCYFKRADANAETFKHDWFRSGDEGFFQFDEQGRKHFFISGRLKEIIVRGGINYSPLEVDEVISGVAGVKAGMAVGFENSFYGEEIGAYVVRDDGSQISEEEVLRACGEKLPFERRPKVVIFGDEFPVTTTGKYQRNKLKPLFADYRESRFSKPV